VVSSMRPAARLDNPPTGEQFILNPAVDSRRTFAGGGERIPEATTGTESLQTLCWREMDSNHRSPGYGELCCRALRPFRVVAVSRAPPQRA
jgi:hypothetical protein